MTKNEKLCLKWSDFQEAMTTSFCNLREESDFYDVTLVCEEGRQIEAHRVILSACSPFFRSVLKQNKYFNPIIYMRGLKMKDLVAMIDFIYHGEANIYQEDIKRFLNLAEEIELKGLTGSSLKGFMENHGDHPNVVQKATKKTEVKKEELINQEPKMDHCLYKGDQEDTSHENKSPISTVVGKTKVPVDSSFEDVKAKIYSMMEKCSEGMYIWKCMVCGKPGKDRTSMSMHIESHLEGVSYPCDKCGKSSRSSSGLSSHVAAYHK